MNYYVFSTIQGLLEFPIQPNPHAFALWTYMYQKSDKKWYWTMKNRKPNYHKQFLEPRMWAMIHDISFVPKKLQLTVLLLG